MKPGPLPGYLPWLTVRLRTSHDDGVDAELGQVLTELKTTLEHETASWRAARKPDRGIGWGPNSGRWC
ncbi:hypothetical protein OG809_31370 [Kribbella soli]